MTNSAYLYLEQMSSGLRQNICNLPADAENVDERTIDNNLSPELQYACQNWVYRLEDSKQKIADGDKTHLFLQMHLLHWLEAMSLMKRLGICVYLLSKLKALVTSSASNISSFLQDAMRFIFRFQSILADFPIQLYYSALIFAPPASMIQQIFQDQVPWRFKRLLQSETDLNACRSTLEGHSGKVQAVAFSPDGKLVASASSDGTVRLWHPKTGVLCRKLEGHSNKVNAVAFSPDRKLVASASNDSTVRLWDTKGACLWTLRGDSGSEYLSVVFSPDGLVASIPFFGPVGLWDATTGKRRKTPKESCYVSTVFSPDKKLVASATYDNTVQLWDAETTRVHRTLEGHSDHVSAVAFSPDGKLVASASDDGTVRLWNAKTGAHCTLEGHSSGVDKVVFSPDGKLVASASWDTTVRLWDTKTGACRRTLEGHFHYISAVAFCQIE